MAAAVHLSLFVAIVLATVWALVRHRSRPTLRRLLAAGVLLVVPACSASAGLHKCDSGAPLLQWLVPSVALMLVVLAVEPVRLQLLLGGALALAAVGLSFHYAEIVHGPTWIGNPDSFALDGERAERRWYTVVTGLYRRVPDPTRRRPETIPPRP